MNRIEKKLTYREMQLEAVKILKEVADFCEVNNLKYYICGGTLLGALRHKGFVPWDDDIDVSMPRGDYEKFKELTKKQGCKLNEYLTVNCFDFGNLKSPYCKVLNQNIEIESEYNTEDSYLWVDIFPLDGLPNDEKKIKKLFRKTLFCKKLIGTSKIPLKYLYKNTKNKIKFIPKLFTKIILNIFGIDWVIKKSDKLSQTYDYDSSDLVAITMWGYGPQEKLEKSKLGSKKVIFENLEVNTYECYDYHLRSLYGINYMDLPPKEKRVTHKISVKKIINKK